MQYGNDKCFRTDQLVPYLALDIFRSYPGLAGVYVSGAYSGTLSTVSSGVNSMATVIVNDFVMPNEKYLFGLFKSEPSDKAYTWETVRSNYDAKKFYSSNILDRLNR